MKKVILLVILFANLTILQAQWSLTGNAGTNPPTNFLGTTDANKLIFKVDNTQSGILDYTISLANTGFGYSTLLSNTGTYNTAIGYQSLLSNTSGIYNTANGFFSLVSNTTGSHNTANGAEALSSNNGSYNTVIGYAAQSYTSSGSYNSTNGSFAMYNNTTGSNNVSMGYQALYSNTTSGNLTALGYQALYSNTSGTGNAAVGYQALYSNVTGEENTALGYQALYQNTAGSYNTAIGFGAYSTPGFGSENTAVGHVALQYTTGSYNTAIGEYTLNTNTTGNENTALGWDADVNQSDLVNSVVIGEGATGTASNSAVIGNASMTSIGGFVGWSNLSDGRFKKNVKQNVPGLEFIKQLQPITYTLDVTGLNKFLRPSPQKDKNGKAVTSSSETQAIQEKEKIVYTGFIAQDVQTVAKKMNYDFSGIDAAKSDKDLYKLRYSDFVVPLVKALQELSNANDSLKTLVDTLQSQMTSVQQQLNNLQKGSTSVVSLGENPMLNQSYPNPFSSNTVISYYIPANTGTAQIIIMDINGRSLKNIVLGSKGPGQVIIAAGTLASGTYTYSLMVDGTRIDTKQMILVK